MERYKIDWLRKSKDELRGRCPIHNGEGSDTFHVSLSKNIFHCFSCKKRGNVLDFVAAMENCNVRDAALKISEWFSINGQAQESTVVSHSPHAESRGEAVENKPLTFQLKGIDPSHPYLSERGIDRQTAETFGLGYFPGKGSMAGRVVIPIHNEKGELLAYAGRSIDGSEPRYKLPARFHKSLELYNLHRAIENNDRKMVVVVEGFFDSMKVHQAGFATVALMGSSLSDAQEQLLIKHFQLAWLLFDSDEAGRAGAKESSQRLLTRMFVRMGDVGDRRQPDRLSVDQLLKILESD